MLFRGSPHCLHTPTPPPLPEVLPSESGFSELEPSVLMPAKAPTEQEDALASLTYLEPEWLCSFFEHHSLQGGSV